MPQSPCRLPQSSKRASEQPYNQPTIQPSIQPANQTNKETNNQTPYITYKQHLHDVYCEMLKLTWKQGMLKLTPAMAHLRWHTSNRLVQAQKSAPCPGRRRWWRSRRRRTGTRGPSTIFRRSHLCNATCLTHALFKSGESNVATCDDPGHDETRVKQTRPY